MQSAKANLKRLWKLDLENIAVKLPLDSYIDKINSNKGVFIKVQQKITNIVNSDHVLVILYVSESEVDKIEIGSTAQINLLGRRKLK